MHKKDGSCLSTVISPVRLILYICKSQLMVKYFILVAALPLRTAGD